MDRLSASLRVTLRHIALDLRSLAAFRIGLGFLIILDLLMRLGDLSAFYTDQGIIPRSLLSIGLAYESQWSFHLMNGTATFQVLLFLVAGVAAGMMAAGYRTRLATLVSWLMLVSLHTRNPLVLNAGDKYLAILTFWGIFLPLGEVWSLDPRKQDASQPQAIKVGSLATFALYLQIVFLYVSTGWLKSSVEAWQTGEAIRCALLKDYLVTHWGQRLLEYPDLLEWLTRGTIFLEIIGPFALLLSQGWVRVLVVTIFVVFHLGLAACFTIGLFPYVCIVGFLAFLPSVFWNKVLRHVPGEQTVFWRPATSSWLGRAASQGILLFALVVAFWSNMQTVNPQIGMPEPLGKIGLAFRWPQSWRLFVDLGEVDNGWFVFHAQFADGSSQDLLTGVSPVSYEKPDLASATFKNFRWRKLCTNVRLDKFKPVANYLGEYLLLERDRAHHDIHKLVGLQINYVKPKGVSNADKLQIFGSTFRTSVPLTREVLYEWENEARKYHDVFIRE